MITRRLLWLEALASFAVSAMVVLPTMPAEAQPLTGDWSRAYAVPGPTGDVTDVLALGDSLLISGQFRIPASPDLLDLALWDGQMWSAVHSLDPNASSIIYVLGPAPGGRVLVGGDFASIGGASSANVATLDLGSRTWSGLGSGVGGPVYGFAVLGDRIYVYGSFLSAGGSPARTLAAYTVSTGTWDGLGTSGGGGVFVANAATVYGGRIVVGGRFTAAAGTPARNLAVYDPQTGGWAEFGGGANARVETLASNGASGLFVSGTFTEIGGVAADAFAAYDGSAWRSLTAGPPDGVFGESASDFLAPPTEGGDAGLVAAAMEIDGVATRGVATWDGASWSPLGPLFPGPLPLGPFLTTQLARTRSGAVVAAARRIFAPNAPVPPSPIRMYSAAGSGGGAWTTLAEAGADGPDHSVTALVVGTDGCTYVGGYFEFVGALPAQFVACRRAGRWEALGDGLPSVPSDLAVLPDGALYAALSDVAGGSVWRWENRAWTLRSSGIGTVFDLAVGPDGALYSAGAGGVFRYDGSGRALVGGTRPSPDGLPYALAFAPDGRLFAGGQYASSAGVPFASVLVWDGVSWETADPSTDLVYALVFAPDGTLYAGRNGRVDRYDGTEWVRVGPPGARPDEGDVYTLAVVDEHIVAGGAFGGVVAGGRASFVASWDGVQWSAVGGGVVGSIRALALEGSVLWVGGALLTVDSPSIHDVGLAALTLSPVSGESSPALSDLRIEVYPNPTTGPLTLRGVSATEAEIYDTLGRRVRSVTLGTGSEVPLDLSGLPAGVYVVRAGSMTTRVVVR